MLKSIGGDRLGSGQKMKVELHEYQRSTHNLSYLFRSSMAAGTLVPFLIQPGMPGDTFDIDLNADVKTHPTLGPLFGSFKVQLDVFQFPIRIYQSALMQNTLNVGNNMSQVWHPAIQQTIAQMQVANIYANPDNIQINPSALLSYLGIRGWGYNPTAAGVIRTKSALPLLGYWEIYKNYYANKQETNGAYITGNVQGAQTVTTVTIDGTNIPKNSQYPPVAAITFASSLVINYTGTAPTLSQILFQVYQGPQVPASQLGNWTNTGTSYTLTNPTAGGGYQISGWLYQPANTLVSVGSFPLTNIDTIKTLIMQQTPLSSRVIINSGASLPYGDCVNIAKTPSSQQGLALKTYQSDLLNNWMQTAWYTTISTTSAVSTVGNTFTIDALILARKVYDLLNRIAISGGTYQDYISAAYAHEPYSMVNSPVYHGGLSKELVFQEVISNAGASSQPLGTLAGRGVMAHKHKGGKIRIRVDEHSYIMGIVSLTPRLDYSQGNRWDTDILTMDQWHKPGLDQIGFQDLITEQMAWWDTNWTGAVWSTPSAGKQPSWLNYQTEINRVYGNFADVNNEMFMVLTRRYQMNPANGRIIDLTTYIDPSKFNYIFAETSLDSQNFWTQIAVDMQVRRKMSAKIMPNL